MIYPTEMKLRIIIVIVALGLGFGWVQRAKFTELQVEAKILGNQVSKLASRISPRGNASLSEALAHRTTRESDGQFRRLVGAE